LNIIGLEKIETLNFRQVIDLKTQTPIATQSTLSFESCFRNP